jgi:ribosomal protein L11 methyltransferase
LIVANIVASVLLRLIPQAMGILKPGGYVILGGILALHKDKMLSALENYGFYLIKQDAQGDWVTLAAKKG